MKILNLKAYAKINIGLEVLFGRSDGFHEINTVLSRICLHDVLIIEENPFLSVECVPSIKIPEQDNLVYKAALLLQKALGIEKTAKITIKKNIPLGAGLGGGSSDAASALQGLQLFWELYIEPKKIFDLALSLGSDVPFFLREGSAIAEGRGELLEYFEYTIPYAVLLVFPNIKISTRWAYQNHSFDAKPKHKTEFKEIILKSLDNPYILKEHVFNDFEPLVFEKYPEIAEIKNQLYSAGAIFASMSGSGSSVYGFFRDNETAAIANNNLKNYRTHLCVLSK